MVISSSVSMTLRFIAAAAAAVALVVFVAAAGVMVAEAQDITCQGDLQGLATMCGPYVQKVGPRLEPSRGCCDVIRTTDVVCVCQHIPREIEQMLDMDKVAFVSQFCGKPIPRGLKCGGGKRVP